MSIGSRTRWVALGAAAMGVGFSMAAAVDHGVTRQWSGAVRSIWAGGLIVLVLVGLGAILYGLGLVSNERLASMRGSESTRDLPVGAFFATYGGSLLVGVALGLYLERRLGLPEGTGFFFPGGLLFLAAASRRPWWLYETIRRAGWFAAISDDRIMRVLLLTLGVLLLGSGFRTAGITWQGLPADSYASRAYRAANAGDLARARHLAEQAIERDSTHAQATHLLSRVCFDEKDYACALEEARRLVDLQPMVGPFHEDLGMALLGGGSYDEALPEFEAAVQFAPNLESAWLSRARMAYMLGRFAEADSSYAALQDLDPGLLNNLEQDKAMWDSARAAQP